MIDTTNCLSREVLFSYSHRLLEPREESGVREHVGRCAACKQTVLEFQQLDTVLDEWKPVVPSSWFDARVRAAVNSSGGAPSGFTLFGMRWAQVLAPACLAILVMAASLMISRVQPNRALRNAAQTNRTVKSPAAQVEEELTLYKDLPVLEDEDYDMLANFDVLSELPHGETKVEN